jgi:glycosyltransferase involved in cell wall biosynthesis
MRLTGKPVVIDAHNAGLFPLDGSSTFLTELTNWTVMRAKITIVSNEALAAHVKGLLGTPAILPDPLPIFETNLPRFRVKGRRNVLSICTWAADEPFLETIAAAKFLEQGTIMYVTGDDRGRLKKLPELPSNVELTGFLSEEAFVSLLHTVDVVIDLTTREDCLVCGAYESVSAGVPLVLSDTTALRNYFGDAALYCDNTSEDIATKINSVLKHHTNHVFLTEKAKSRISTEWLAQKVKLEAMLHALEIN